MAGAGDANITEPLWGGVDSGMAKLIVTVEGEKVGEFTLDNQERFAIGRLPENNLQPEDQTVSKRHALVTRSRNVAFVEDLGSTNGTLVNGRKIRKCMLVNGDVIEVGSYRIRYVDEKATAFARTIVAGQSVTESGETKEPPPAKIRVLAGPDAGRVLGLNKPFTPVGKLGAVVLVIARRRGGYSVLTMGGTGATATINGPAVTGSGYLLRDRDLIELAGSKMEFVVGD